MQRLNLTHVDGGDVKMVGVRMFLASEDVGNNDACKASRYFFLLADAVDLDAYGGHSLGNSLGVEVTL